MKTRFAILPVLTLMLGVSVWAQKIAVVDMQGALLSTVEGKKAADELKSKFGPKEAELNTRSQDLQAKQDTYRKTGATAGATDKARMERDIDSLQKALQRDADDAKADFEAEQSRLLGGIMQKMQAVMTKYATDKQLSMIVDVSSQPNNLLYADQSVNISAEIVKAYDESAVALAAPAPAAAPRAPATAAPKTLTPRPPAGTVK